MSNPVCKDFSCDCFPHGENRGHSRGCRCERCTAAYNRQKRLSTVMVNTGRRRRRPVGPTKRHVRSLLDQGATVLGIATATEGKVGWSGVYDLLQARRTEIHWKTEAALRAVTLEAALLHAPLTSNVSAKRPTQQIRSMMALGYSGRWIAEQLGYQGQTNVAFVSQHRTQVTLEMAQRVDALARQVGDRPGPSVRARLSAHRSGWRVPGAYTDEGDLIPGAALADEQETCSGRVAVRREAVQRMLTEGLTHGEIAQRLGVSRYVIEKDISRGGLEQIAA